MNADQSSLAHPTPATAKPIVFGALSLTPNGPVRIGENFVVLTPSERKIVEYLIASHPAYISRVELEVMIWGADTPQAESNVLQVMIARIRRKLGRHEAIVTKRGRGYSMGEVTA
jgi:DNA-binding response OmpR family regulator